jgi:putative ABC transport system permease protein
MNGRLREYWLRFLSTLRPRSNELEEELRFHLEIAEQRALRRGGSVREARLHAGGLLQASEAVRDQSTIGCLGDFSRDTRHGIRLLLKSPVFTAAAMLSLAFGIGANTAIFTVVNGVLLRPLAYKDSGRLVTILSHGTGPVAAANYLDWREQSRSFESMGAAEAWSPDLTGIDRPEHLLGLRMTQSMLPLLAVTIARRSRRPAKAVPARSRSEETRDFWAACRAGAQPASKPVAMITRNAKISRRVSTLACRSFAAVS